MRKELNKGLLGMVALTKGIFLNMRSTKTYFYSI